MRKRLGERLLRYFYLAGGLLCLALAGVGVVVPGLPTTIFLILAAGAFVRSCPFLHRWMLQNRLFGPRLQSWYDDPTLPRIGKLAIATAITVSILTSLALARPPMLLALAGLALAACGVWWVWVKIPTRVGGPAGRNA